MRWKMAVLRSPHLDRCYDPWKNEDEDLSSVVRICMIAWAAGDGAMSSVAEWVTSCGGVGEKGVVELLASSSIAILNARNGFGSLVFRSGDPFSIQSFHVKFDRLCCLVSGWDYRSASPARQRDPHAALQAGSTPSQCDGAPHEEVPRTRNRILLPYFKTEHGRWWSIRCGAPQEEQ
jgi:hypothetical protein